MTGYREFGIGQDDEGIGSPPKRLLEVELVPATVWGANLRSILKPAEWDRLRKAVYERAGHRCEICGGKGRKHPVEAHEKWEYDDTAHVQKLVGIEALCPDCHGVKHIGRLSMTGEAAFTRGLRHLAKVNGWPLKEAREYVSVAFLDWQTRSEHPWTLDISWLRDAKL